MSSSFKSEDGYKKTIGKYLISFCHSEYYGKSLHGEMRAGLQCHNNKLFIFRINPLPLTNSMKTFLELQETFSLLKHNSRTVYENIKSSSSNYTVLQFFPKTFESQIENFRQNTKYFQQMIEKFLRTYSLFYSMKLPHGNLVPSNIGITFDSRVKLMDFYVEPKQQNEENFHKDFQNFKSFISRILQKESDYPEKFDSFNSKNTSNWQHLFCCWNISSPFEQIYISKTNYMQNIVTGLYKLQISLNQLENKNTIQQKNLQNLPISQDYRQKNNPFIQSQEQKTNDLKMAIRLVQLNFLSQSEQKHLLGQKQTLAKIISPDDHLDIDYYNSVLIGAIRDHTYYKIDPSRRLFLLSCLMPFLNHEYIYYEVIEEFGQNEEIMQRNLILGDSLLSKFRKVLHSNLIKKSILQQSK